MINDWFFFLTLKDMGLNLGRRALSIHKTKNPVHLHKGGDFYDLVLCLNLGAVLSIRAFGHLRIKMRKLKGQGRNEYDLKKY